MSISRVEGRTLARAGPPGDDRSGSGVADAGPPGKGWGAIVQDAIRLRCAVTSGICVSERAVHPIRQEVRMGDALMECAVR